MVGEPKVVNVILSEAKNLVLVRDAADMPRSFAALRMTICRSFAEKIDTLFRGHDGCRLRGKQIAGESPLRNAARARPPSYTTCAPGAPFEPTRRIA